MHHGRGVLEKDTAEGTYRPKPPQLWRVPDALARLRRMLPGLPHGAPLKRFLPEPAGDGTPDAALANTLLAGLEMSRNGVAELHQDKPFSTVRVAPSPSL